jgi:hypothetical protein
MKIRKIGSLSAFLLITFLLMACSENQKAAKPFSIKAIFPAGIVENSIEISSEIRTFSKDSLWVYIDGGAEEYLKHNVIEAATADLNQARPLLWPIYIVSIAKATLAKCTWISARTSLIPLGLAWKASGHPPLSTL